MATPTLDEQSSDDEVAILRARLATLGAPQRRARRLSRTRVVVVVAAGALLLVVGDWYAQNREMDALVGAAEARQVAYEDLKDRWDALGADGNVGGDLSKQHGVMDVVRPQMLLATRDAEGVDVLPWHSDIASARDAFLDYSHANDDFLAVLGTGDGQAEVDTAPMDAAEFMTERLLPTAVPVLAMDHLDERVKDYLQARQE